MPGEMSMQSPEMLVKDDVVIVGGLAPFTSAALKITNVERKQGEVEVAGLIIYSSGQNVDKLPTGTVSVRFNSDSFVATVVKEKDKK